MDDKKGIKKKLKNSEGKRMLEKTYLNYSMEIIKKITQNPQLLNELLEELEISETDFINYISGEKKANITFYDQTLKSINKKIDYKDNNKSNKKNIPKLY
jgi:formylmethanofuran dehydrogenase subunit E-like metal-binding protein